jgi:5-formyltetrahydrofolate cyclo-ligase
MQKNQLRQKIFLLRKNVSQENRDNFSGKIVKKLISYLETITYNNIAIYYPIKNEVNILLILNYLWKNKKKILLPVSLKNGEIEFKLWEKDTQLVKDAYKIPVPDSATFFPKELIDILIVPCVACDKNNNRLGYGKGFYDRLLQRINPISIGICYNFQLLEQLPTDKNDKKLSKIISD